MPQRMLLKSAVVAVGLGLAVSMFQSCGPVRLKGQEQKPTVQGNGDFYSGKTDLYAYSDQSAPCTTLGRSGTPLPNRQIQYFSDSASAYLVRNACQDMEPVLIPPSEYQINPITNAITYQGQQFDLEPDFHDHDIVPAMCPPAMTPVAAANPQNFFASNLELFTPAWTANPGISSGLFGTIEALPRYQVRRNDSAFLDFYRRLSQYVPLAGNTRYAASFLVSRGNTNSASIMYWDSSVYQFTAHVDFATGQTFITYLVGFANGSVTATATPYGAGYIFTVFFTRPVGTVTPEIGIAPTNYDVGLTPLAGQVGDYVNVTSAGLRRVNDYCN